MNVFQRTILALGMAGIFGGVTPSLADISPRDIRLAIELGRNVAEVSLGAVTYASSFSSELDDTVRERAETPALSVLGPNMALGAGVGGILGTITLGSMWILGIPVPLQYWSYVGRGAVLFAGATGAFSGINKALWNYEYYKRGLGKH